MTIGERIYELRRKNYVSQEELADVMQVSRQSVSKWETDQSYPELDKIAKLAKYFNVTTDYLITGEEITDSQNDDNTQENPQQNAQEQSKSKSGFLFNWHYEYISKTKVGNVPLVHINLGVGFPPNVARGIIAIGNIAQGIVAIGPIAIGLFSFGSLCIGLLSFGGLVLGLLASCGGISVGLVFAAGGLAVSGFFATGGIAVGHYAIGGIAIGKNLIGGLEVYTSVLRPLYRL